MEEYKHLKRIATVNGFDTQRIDQLVSNHSRKLKKRNMTTLLKVSNNDSPYYCKFTFLGPASLEISKILRKYNIECVFSNKGNFLALIERLHPYLWINLYI